VATEMTGFDKARLDQLLDPRNQTGSEPGQEFRTGD